MAVDIDPNQILKIYKFLKIDNFPSVPVNGAFVFCRDDPLIATKTAELFKANLIEFALLTGGIGKDSGNLDIPESVFQNNILNDMGISENKLIIETNASNGAENTCLGLHKLIESCANFETMVCVSHPTNSRRLFNVHRRIIRDEFPQLKAKWAMASTDYKFDPSNIIDQKEAVDEIIKLHDWVEKGWTTPEPDLNVNLVEYAKSVRIMLTSN